MFPDTSFLLNVDYRNYYKGHMDKIKREGGSGEGRWVWLGWGVEGWGEKADSCN